MQLRKEQIFVLAVVFIIINIILIITLLQRGEGVPRLSFLRFSTYTDMVTIQLSKFRINDQQNVAIDHVRHLKFF